MRVFTKKSFKFVCGDKSVVTKALAFSDLPDWVKNDSMFDWGRADGDIEIIHSKADELRAEDEVSNPQSPVDEDDSSGDGDPDDDEEDEELDETTHAPRKLRKK